MHSAYSLPSGTNWSRKKEGELFLLCSLQDPLVQEGRESQFSLSSLPDQSFLEGSLPSRINWSKKLECEVFVGRVLFVVFVYF